MTSLHSMIRKLLLACGALIALNALRAAFGLFGAHEDHSLAWFCAMILDLGAAALLAGFCFSFAEAIGDHFARRAKFHARLLRARSFLVQYAGAVLAKSGALLALLIQENGRGFQWWMLNNATTEFTELLPMIAAACVLVELVRECSELRELQEGTV